MIFQIFGLKIMFGSFILLYLAVVPVAGLLCSGNQITWIDQSGQVIGCSPCPGCPPGSEYSIPCSTKALNGTPAKCVSCPPGKFSSQFNNRPCVACTHCSKRYIRKFCTPLRNAECGDCIAGYYYNKVIFGCEECGRCCRDGKDKAPSGCARVGMCKTRPYGCPKDTLKTPTKLGLSVASKTSTNISRVAKYVKKSSRTPKIGTPTFTTYEPLKLYLTKFVNKTSPTPKPVKNTERMPVMSEGGRGLQDLVLVAVGLLIVTILLLVVIAVYTHYKTSTRPVYIRSTSYTTNPFSPEPSPKDRTLEDFVENAITSDAVESVCVLLYDKRKDGMFDFERIALRFGLSQEERISIKNSINVQGDNPTRELLRVLCSKRPKITVKQFAEIVKNIKRNEVYEKLIPFFVK